MRVFFFFVQKICVQCSMHRDCEFFVTEKSPVCEATNNFLQKGFRLALLFRLALKIDDGKMNRATISITILYKFGQKDRSIV